MDEVAGAVADPVRREILLMLRDEPLSAGQIAGRFPISRPAVSRHLRVLRAAGLVRDVADGRRRVYTLVTAPLDELAGWLTRLTRPAQRLESEVDRTRREPGPAGWLQRLDALETEVDRTRREPGPAGWHQRLDALETEVYRTRRERHPAADRQPIEPFSTWRGRQPPAPVDGPGPLGSMPG